jgi:uncharacterized RDD family membrane protein YckC
MRSRFELDGTGGTEDGVPLLAASESVDETETPSRFVVDEDEFEESLPTQEDCAIESPEPGPLQPTLIPTETDDSWRNEVADRVNRYRARRRPRTPRYPSLTLKFESPEPRSPRFPAPDQSVPTTNHALAMDSSLEVFRPELTSTSGPVVQLPVENAKVLEFPRSLTLPSRPLDELADPVIDRPRILEVPDIAPPPPALGGILIEPAPEREEEKRPGFEIPLQPARLSRRLGAAAIDAIFVLTACALFGYIFFRVTAIVPPLPFVIETSIILSAVLWISYQYLCMVFAGTTPGLKLAKLHLHRFDGSPVPRRLRQWRMLASLLSGISLGLGYAWCFLDEDQLCWHDRITHTYMAPK